MQPEGLDSDSLDVSTILQILLTLPEKDWHELAVGYLSKLPSYLWSSESSDQPISIVEVLSRWPHDVTAIPLHPTTVDPREVLSILISLSYTVNAHALHDYSILVFNSYRQVLFGNMRRRLDSMEEVPSSPKGMLHARNSVLLSMKPWARDIIELLEKQILPNLVVRDASPQTVEAGIGGDRHDSHSPSDSHTDGPRCEGLDSVFPLIVNLLQDMADSSTLRDACARCAVALYGTMWSSMDLCAPLTIGGVSVLERIRDEYQRANGKIASSDFVTKTVLPSNGFVLPATERAVLREKIFKLLCRALGVESPSEALLQLLCDEMDNPPSEPNGDHYFFNDWEEGRRPPISKTLTLWQERERALAKLRVWDFSETHYEEPSDFASDERISIVVNLGLFYLLISFLTSQREVPLLISSSPLSFFFTISSVLAASLKCTSAAALLGVLLFLGQCIRCIPKYSIEFPGEREDLANRIGHKKDASDYRTEQYRVFFEILKELVGVSVMCPNPIHRTLSRFLTLELLKCLEEHARIRTHMTLLVLTPFGSVARVVLDNVLKEWDFSRNATRTDISNALLSDMPRGVVNAMQSFLQHIKNGKSEFIDPLIVALNFFRLFIVKDRSAAEARTLIYDDDDKLILTEDRVDAKRMKEGNSWPWAVRYLAKTILPNCRQCLSAERRDSGQKVSGRSNFFLPVALSPLEEFALSSAVDGVSALLPVAESGETGLTM